MDDVRNTLCALALDRPAALETFDAQWQRILDCFAHRRKRLYRVLDQVARRLAAIPLKRPPDEAPRVLLAGESFVRKDEFCSQALIGALARRGIVVQRSPLLEWFQYVDYWVQHIDRRKLSLTEKLELQGRILVQRRIEKRIKRLLARSGLYHYEVTEIDDVMRVGERFVNHLSGGEPVLVVGRFFKDVLRDFHGMISIGPFACLPTRVVESIITPESRTRGNDRLDALPNARLLKSVAKLPFLTIEVDGNPLPQIIEAQLEAFALQVERLHREHDLGADQPRPGPQTLARRLAPDYCSVGRTGSPRA
jgi:hypothetical protein